MTGAAPRGPASIRIRGWGWRHAGRRAWALRDLDLSVEPGERVLLLGPSGSGKSTLLQGLAGLLDPESGETAGALEIDGVDPRLSRGRVGLVMQDPESQLVMGRAGDDVAFGPANLGVSRDEIWFRVDAALAAVGFPYGRDHPTGALSGGEQQRLVLAGTIAMQPGLLLLDEPTANLDPVGAGLVRETVRRICADRARTLLLVEHRVAEVLDLVDRVVVLEPGGGVRVDGPPGEVFDTYGEALAAMGVWIPGVPTRARRAPSGRAPGESLVEAVHAGFRYPGAPRPAVEDASLALRAGTATALVGPNGSGKSTLAMLLAGLARPSPGEVIGTSALAGSARTRSLSRWPARLLADHVGTVFQDPEHQFLTSTVRAELALGPSRVGVAPREVTGRVDDLLARLHLDHLATANPFTLSGGEKRRLSVGTAIACRPQVLVLDEPTFGQDRRTWLELLDLLVGLRDAGSGLCLATHDEAFGAALADEIAVLDQGRIGQRPTGGAGASASTGAADLGRPDRPGR